MFLAYRPVPYLTIVNVFVLAAGLTGPGSAARRADEGTGPTNVVLILTDDQGYGDVGVHGNTQIRTPHLDRFAREGVQLTRFYCSPVCAPTRACLMTGRYYYRTGVIHTSRGGAKMHGDEVTIAELLGQAGYATGIFGKWHLGDNYPMRPQDQGFAETLFHKSGGIGQTPDKPNSYFDPLLWQNSKPVKTEGYCTDVFTDAALRFIETNSRRPFFIYLATNAPHTPLEIAERYVQPYRRLGLDETTAKVYGMVENIDDNVGRLLTKLESLGLRQNTLVLFMTDNGPQQKRYTAGLRGRKSSVYEGGIRVPCFVQWPDRLPGAQTLGQVAAHIDILPTVLEACGIDTPQDLELDGMSLLPQLSGEKGSRKRTLFFQCHRGLMPQPYHNCAVVTERYKLVGNPDTFGQEELADDRAPTFELYDLEEDPGESRDRAADLANTTARLRNAYEAWFHDVRSSRRFTPGVIQIGAEAENPQRLCRYQDGTYESGYPYGWPVEIVRGGKFELRIQRGPDAAPGHLFVSWQGSTASKPLTNGHAVFQLPSGQGRLDVWYQAEGQSRQRIGDNSTFGDVDVRRID